MKRIAVLTLMAILVLGVEMVFPAGVSQSHQVLAAPQQNGIDTMAMAHQLYESGQYAKAAEAYQQLVDQGYSDAALFYNLGNAYFKQGDIGRAILNYRRAERLHPRDPDTRANLELARSLAVDQIEDGNQSGLLYQWTKTTARWGTINEMSLLILGLWFLVAALVIVFSHYKRGSRLREVLTYALILVSVVLVVVLLPLGNRLYLARTQQEGVIVSDEVEVTSGPGVQHVTEFKLHAGAEVQLIERRGSWVRLTLTGENLEGWVPASAIEAVAVSGY